MTLTKVHLGPTFSPVKRPEDGPEAYAAAVAATEEATHAVAPPRPGTRFVKRGVAFRGVVFDEVLRLAQERRQTPSRVVNDVLATALGLAA